MKQHLYNWAAPVLIVMLLGTQCKQAVTQQQAPTAATGQTSKKQSMKLNAGVITTKLAESKEFYQRVLKFGITFENDFYLLMHTPDQQTSFAFLLPDHPSQQPIFQPAFTGKGMFLTIEVEDADAEYRRIKDLGVDIKVPIRDEPWGDRHFSFYDPNGIGIDIVKYAPPAQ
ncbi:VOC family protein [Paraflavitalea sp. CAU 1676]|uniref:VOC family protein n=1 Tax=Paraflavitalea sp. CAU 1676 TaxID=3032598 RepID=UPI0023DA0DCC|nr:VOC family protein [Paraflavitalea sp. CAU 1676]MDF2187002.1 VOC family protein [Paraflavitalea sp. CAU 1676]